MAFNLSILAPPTSISDNRLTLRRHQAEDAGALCDAALESREQLYPFMEWCHPDYKLDDSKEWITLTNAKWSKKEWYDFSIWHPQSKRFLGGCGLNNIRTDQRTANLGYWVRTSETNKGIATHATCLMAAFAFEHLDLLRIEIVMAEDNLASRIVAEKAGAILEGKLRNRLILHQVPTDAYLYSLIPDDLISS
jgi:RimJ/RimL family protein N-acetyltransferase